jgi:hypothetical protein
MINDEFCSRAQGPFRRNGPIGPDLQNQLS